MLNQVLRPIVLNVTRSGTRSASTKVMEVKLPTINDIPVPCGPWREHYEKRQKVYNTQLIIGLTTLLSTIAFVKMSGIVIFNWGPPEEPKGSK